MTSYMQNSLELAIKHAIKKWKPHVKYVCCTCLLCYLYPRLSHLNFVSCSVSLLSISSTIEVHKLSQTHKSNHISSLEVLKCPSLPLVTQTSPGGYTFPLPIHHLVTYAIPKMEGTG